MRTHSRASRGVREPGEVSGFNRTNDLLSGEGQIAPLIRNKSSARFPHLGVSMQGSATSSKSELATSAARGVPQLRLGEAPIIVIIGSERSLPAKIHIVRAGI
jgi:hypothetical protein